MLQGTFTVQLFEELQHSKPVSVQNEEGKRQGKKQTFLLDFQGNIFFFYARQLTLWMSSQLLVRGATVPGTLAVLAEVASSPFWFLWTANVISFPCRKRRNTRGGRQNGQLYITNCRSKWHVQIPAWGLNCSFIIHLQTGRDNRWQRGHSSSFSLLTFAKDKSRFLGVSGMLYNWGTKFLKLEMEEREAWEGRKRNIMRPCSDFEWMTLMSSWKSWSSRSWGERAEDSVSSVAETLGLALACLSRVFWLRSSPVIITCLAWMQIESSAFLG